MMTRYRHVFVIFAFVSCSVTTSPATGQLIPRTPLPKPATISKPAYESRLTVKFRDDLKAQTVARNLTVRAGEPTCPDSTALYEQCPNFASNGAEGQYYARSDVVLDVSAADNFTLQAQGAISRIRLWGTYLISDAACALFPDNFTVRFWRNANGNPIGPDPLPIPAYTVTRSADSVGEIPAALGAPAPVFEYELTFAHDGFQAEPDETYWLEIQNDYTLSGGCYWVWLTARDAPGDGSSRQRSPSTDPDWSAPTARGFDLAFSLFSDAGGPIPTVSGWALVTMIALLLGTGAIILRRRGGPENHHSHGRHF